MPKEVVYLNSAASDPRQYAIHVGWHRELGQVQIASLGGPSGIALDSGTADGQYVNLDDRAQINRLIRILRQARDAAFGADA